MAELRRHFRPEFLNRVDDTVLFKPLTLADIKQIVDLQLTLLRARLADRHITLDLTDAAKEHTASEAYEPVCGAGPFNPNSGVESPRRTQTTQREKLRKRKWNRSLFEQDAPFQSCKSRREGGLAKTKAWSRWRPPRAERKRF
jgi:hypothetical protein